MSDLPIHPIIGFRAIGLRKNGSPIWPVMGASEDHTGPVPGVGDGNGAGGSGGDSGQGGDGAGGQQGGGEHSGGDGDRGFPANTPIKDMTTEQQAAYWKFHDRRKSDRLDAFEGITPEQAKQWKADAENARRDGLPADQRPMEDARNEAAAAATTAANEQWASVLADQVISQFVEDKEQREAMVAVLNPMAFMKDGKFDSAALIGHLTTVYGGGQQQQSGAGGHRETPQWGQNGGTPPAQSGKEQGLAEAKRRGYIKEG